MILVIGSINQDHAFEIDRFPNVGETLTANGYSVHPGGKGANQAVGCARMGAEVAFLGAVGDDSVGEELMRGLEKEGIDLRHTRVKPGATGTAMILIAPNGQNKIVVNPGANSSIGVEDVTRDEVFDGVTHLLIQQEIPAPVIEAALAKARERGIVTILNPAPHKVLHRSIYEKVDFLVPNEEEQLAMTGMHNRERGAKELLSWGAGKVITTLGSEGCLYTTPDYQLTYEAYAVKAVDTTAAGDSFIGGLATGLIEGLSVEKAIDRGQRAASIAIQRLGAQPSLAYRGEVLGEEA
jgi:ribokinase